MYYGNIVYLDRLGNVVFAEQVGISEVNESYRIDKCSVNTEICHRGKVYKGKDLKRLQISRCFVEIERLANEKNGFYETQDRYGNRTGFISEEQVFEFGNSDKKIISVFVKENSNTLVDVRAVQKRRRKKR